MAGYACGGRGLAATNPRGTCAIAIVIACRKVVAHVIQHRPPSTTGKRDAVTDFVEFEPRSGSAGPGPPDDVQVRPATPDDVGGLAAVKAVRGGTAEQHAAGARRQMEQLAVLVVAEDAAGDLVGWSGAQQVRIHLEGSPEWLVAGLTVVPARRRQGVGALLLAEVVTAVRRVDEGAAVHSVVNAQNLASIALHLSLGFREVARGTTFAGVTFSGGEGVLLGLRAGSPGTGPGCCR